MEVVCLDLEGVLVPEIWVNVAERTGIKELRATTRDVPDYNVLMKQRLRILERNGLELGDIQSVIGELKPMDGAREFVGWLNRHFQLVILSDTFYEFAGPLMAQLDWPTLFCHRLIVDDSGHLADYKLRIDDHKKKAVVAFKGLNFKVFAAGDSYNDTTMLAEADKGFLFRAPDNVVNEFPQFQVSHEYSELQELLIDVSGSF